MTPPFQAASGKIDRDSNLVFMSKFDKCFAYTREKSTAPASPAQTAVRDKFKAVIQLVNTDMSNPETANGWKETALNSNGKFRTHRGAAFSYHWDNYEPAVVE